ncbi:hypothetical protein LUQ84_001523 [Hamiltosporidium tvaerminnensis]|nr:hypothetical protein LUQ84_001523 [Hamiltosporidium tvaerminnensis]
MREGNQIVTNRNLNLNSLLFVLLITLKVIFPQKTIAIHFYRSVETKIQRDSLNNYIYSEVLSQSTLEKRDISLFDIKNKISQIFIIDINIFPLKFLNEDEIPENQQYNIYINNNLLNYDDFVYFYNIVMSFPYLIENINECKYLKIFRIIDIFKFKNDKLFIDFIRYMLASVVFNLVDLEKWNVFSKTKNVYLVNDAISKKVILEFFRLYFIDNRTSNKIRDISRILESIKLYKFVIINTKEDFLYIYNDILQEILKIHKNIKSFQKIFNTIFKIHIFKRLLLFKINYNCKYNCLLDLCLFKNCDEIFLLECLNTEILIQKIYEFRKFIPLKTLSIIDSKFTIKDEISWFETLNVEKFYYVVSKYNSATKFSKFGPESPLCNIFYKFKEQIYNKENESNIYYRDSDCPCYDQNTRIDLKCHQEKSKIERLINIKFPFQEFVYMEVTNSFIKFSFYLMNYKEFQNITIEFSYTNLNDFNLKKLEILNNREIYTNIEILTNIVTMRIYNSILNDIFLSKVLLFPSLKRLFISKSEIIFSKEKVEFDRNYKIESFCCNESRVNNKKCVFDFIYKLDALKEFEISCYTQITNIFEPKFYDENLIMINVTNLKYSVKYYNNDYTPFYSIFPNLLHFNFSFECSEGTLYNIFFKKNFVYLRSLTFNDITVGIKDANALKDLRNLTLLYFNENCKFTEISFCNLFDSNNSYLLEELRFPNMEYTYCDLQFLMRLKFLKKIYVHGFINKNNIIFLLKVFSSGVKITIKNVFQFKNQIVEGFGLAAI